MTDNGHAAWGFCDCLSLWPDVLVHDVSMSCCCGSCPCRHDIYVKADTTCMYKLTRHMYCCWSEHCCVCHLTCVGAPTYSICLNCLSFVPLLRSCCCLCGLAIRWQFLNRTAFSLTTPFTFPVSQCSPSLSDLPLSLDIFWV